MSSELSIRKRLLLGLTSTIFIAWLLAIGMAYLTTANEVEEVYDASLVQYARVLATLMLHEAQEEAEVREKLLQVVKELGRDTIEQKSPLLSKLIGQYMQPDTSEDYLTYAWEQPQAGHPYESKIAFVIQTDDGRVLLRSSANTPVREYTEGFHILRHAGKRWRFFGMVEPEKNLHIMVGERIEIRSEIQRLILFGGLWPIFVAFPLIAPIVWGVVSKGLKPIQLLTNSIARRSPSSLTPIADNNVPTEVLPLVDALNGLFKRLAQALENERNFTANAAHELRTPLAELKTNVQVLDLNLEHGSQKTIAEILTSIDTASHLLDQLLTLARADAKSRDMIGGEQVDMVGIAQSVLTDSAQSAFDKDIDLAFDSDVETLSLYGDAVLLGVMLRNLLDNAIRYTPRGGTITVALEASGKTRRLSVTDSGPGIATEQRELLFNRFQRGAANHISGSGLGLSIVRQIAYLHGIVVRLADAKQGSGLCVELLLPDKPA
ncbi:MAG: ATP-binding protein [Chromatiales bacterium]|jgi:two-component system sensor histidine kinase QseC